uniref:Uncharacterized protein n=1 Tax=Syphacia muris TaxID=451379 RepID=A0A0N5ASG2_9BILA
MDSGVSHKSVEENTSIEYQAEDTKAREKPPEASCCLHETDTSRKIMLNFVHPRSAWLSEQTLAYKYDDPDHPRWKPENFFGYYSP